MPTVKYLTRPEFNLMDALINLYIMHLRSLLHTLLHTSSRITSYIILHILLHTSEFTCIPQI